MEWGIVHPSDFWNGVVRHFSRPQFVIRLPDYFCAQCWVLLQPVLRSAMIADMLGRVNTLILSILMCLVTYLALWLPAGDSAAMIIVFAVIFGFDQRLQS